MTYPLIYTPCSFVESQFEKFLIITQILINLNCLKPQVICFLDMAIKKLSKINGKILVVGPIYDKIEKLSEIKKIISEYSFIIFNGGLCYPFDNVGAVGGRINVINSLLKEQNVIYNVDGHDLKLLQILTENDDCSNISNWIRSKSNVIIAEFDNNSQFIIVGGGIIPSITTQKLLEDNIEISFVSFINEKPWHQSYNGKLGYIISNNPLTSEDPVFYNYSAQIGNKYIGESTKVFAQEIDKYGLQKTVLL